MLVIPAIDIRGGKCVRLLKGDYSRETVYGDDPAEVAMRWLELGARALHLVDLDGAREGRSANSEAVERILAVIKSSAAGHVTTELGGGIRDLAGVDRWLDAGVDRVILGTAAVRDPELVETAAHRHPGRVWVGIDARGGNVAIAGWTQSSACDAVTLARQMEERGAAGIIYTDIERDGTREGINVESTLAVAGAVEIPVYASGGVASQDDIFTLRRACGRRIAGVVVGRALYEQAFTLPDALTAITEN